MVACALSNSLIIEQSLLLIGHVDGVGQNAVEVLEVNGLFVLDVETLENLIDLLLGVVQGELVTKHPQVVLCDGNSILRDELEELLPVFRGVEGKELESEILDEVVESDVFLADCRTCFCFGRTRGS